MAKHRTKKYFDDDGNLILKPYRLKDLAMIFDINASTMKKWIDKYKGQLGEKNGFYYTINQVKFLIDQYGLPQKVNVQSSLTIQ